jgi:predicted dehydrogenase
MNRKDSINIGIIGVGFARRVQIPGFQACKGARVIAIASRTRANADAVAKQFNIPHVANNWREIVSHPEVDLISIVTPPATHAEMTLGALRAGKAVLCEKPMAMNADEANVMRSLARETKLFAYLDHELRFLPSRQRMRRMIEAGEIGEVRHVRYLFKYDAGEARTWDWWSEREQGGGVLGAIGSHAIDAIHWMLNTQTSEVFCALNTHVTERRDEQTGEMRAVTTDDEANLVLRLDGGSVAPTATAAIALSVVESGSEEHRFEIFGSRGALKDERGELWYARAGDKDWTRAETERVEIVEGMPDREWPRGFLIFARRIIETFQEGGTVIEDAANFDNGYRTQLVLDAARRAHEERCVIKVESVKAVNL